MLGSSTKKQILTTTDNFTINGNFNFNKAVQSGVAPTIGSHLTNKTYVDGQVSNLLLELNKVKSSIGSIGGGHFTNPIQ
ncbi:TPA: hypothetical protein SFZ43_000020 [Campylobacter jejuni]|nr:hypothetical protein [Campylobacter jejuni]